MVDEKNIRLVVDGFVQFIRRAAEKDEFNFLSLKNFMEPIFERAGYRDINSEGGGSVLIIHASAAGDFIAMSSAIREIRRIYPTAHITLVVEKRAASLAECCPHIDEVLVEDFTLDGRSIINISYYEHIAELYLINLKVAEKLLPRRFDLAFASNNGAFCSTPLLAYMSGARERLSHVTNISGIEKLLTDDVPQQIYGNHAADKMLSYIEYLIRAPIANRSLEAWVDENDLESAKAMLPSTEKLYAIGLGGARKRKHYPPKSYARLMKMIRRADGRVKFVIIGGPSEVDDAAIIMSNVERNCAVDLTGKTTYRQTTAVLSFCEMYIGNDTGAMHLAAATETPVLNPNCYPLDLNGSNVVFKRWYPYGVPSVIVCPAHALPECRGSQQFFGCTINEPHCITQIKPEALFDAYKVLLKRIEKGIAEPLILGAK